MEHLLHTPLKGILVVTDSFHTNPALQRDRSLYKFIRVLEGRITLEVDHVAITLGAGEVLTLTPLHHVEVREVGGRYAALLFNSDFYCIYGHDNEVSCNGLLFNGSSVLTRLQLQPQQGALLDEITEKLAAEFVVRDSLQEEMLRILLKRFIIVCTRMARDKYSITPDTERGFDIVRQYMVLVDNHFREKKKVQDYALLLHRSPKTLSNLFAAYGLPSPLRIIHERTVSEARRLLLYSTRSAKETAALLGFDDVATFSRFFRKMTGTSISDFRKPRKRNNCQLIGQCCH